jgi:hypothetical protein
MQRGLPKMVCRIGICLFVEQQSGNFAVIALCSQVQWRVTSGIGLGKFGASFEQQSGRCVVIVVDSQ